MENLSPITALLDLPTKEYVDSKAAVGLNLYSGRWGPAWPSPEASLAMTIQPNWIYAYRIMTNVAIQSVGIENIGPEVGYAVGLYSYSDAWPWPGAKGAGTSISLDYVGILTAALSIAKGASWLVIHNISAVALNLRSVIGPNPYSPGSIATGGASAFASGIAYNVGATPPATWPAGTGTDASAISFLVRAT